MKNIRRKFIFCSILSTFVVMIQVAICAQKQVSNIRGLVTFDNSKEKVQINDNPCNENYDFQDINLTLLVQNSDENSGISEMDPSGIEINQKYVEVKVNEVFRGRKKILENENNGVKFLKKISFLNFYGYFAPNSGTEKDGILSSYKEQVEKIANIIMYIYEKNEIGKELINRIVNKIEGKNVSIHIGQRKKTIVRKHNGKKWVDGETQDAENAGLHLEIFREDVCTTIVETVQNSDTYKLKKTSKPRYKITRGADNIFLHRVYDSFGLDHIMGAYKIILPPIISSRQDKNVPCLVKRDGKYCVELLKNPYVVCLVHELIHLMHYLEKDRCESDVKGGAIPDEVGGYNLWGQSWEDLYTITGIKIYNNGSLEKTNEVSEWSFRVKAGIPVRLFYPDMSTITEVGLNPVNLNDIIEFIKNKQNKQEIAFVKM